MRRGLIVKPVLFTALAGGLMLGGIAGPVLAPDQTTGDQTIRGSLQVTGRISSGVAGSQVGSLTLYPPDGSGWYHLDNPGGQQLRISGGDKPGVFTYMTISHPGIVAISGDLTVSNNVGIGTTAPGAKLHVAGGNLRLDGGVLLCSGCVTLAALAANSVDSSKIVDGSVGAVDVNTSQIQARVNGTCEAGQAIRLINVNGTVTCESFGGGGTSGWSLSGNAGTNPDSGVVRSFLGTTDNKALELKVNGRRALRIEPTGVEPTIRTPNLIGGFEGNFVDSGVFGATISGGGEAPTSSANLRNRVRASFGTVGGGRGNQAGDALTDKGYKYATVGGGQLNNAFGEASTVSGGFSNTAEGPSSTVAGGSLNEADFGSSTVGGGSGNVANSTFSTVAGGQKNAAVSELSTVSGGSANRANGKGATVSGGGENKASGVYSTVSGGGGDSGDLSGNTANGDYSTVSGGRRNTASGALSTVGGGDRNTASGVAATVAGGTGFTVLTGNTASGNYATVGGGVDNAASGVAATVPGGSNNVAKVGYSFAAGRNGQANHAGSFVWADSNNSGTSGADFASTAVDQFNVRASGGTRIFSSSDLSTGVLLAAGSGSWSSVSERNAKDNFASVDGRGVLARLASIPISTWNYKAQGSSIRHMGPMAEDFYIAFGLGEDNQHISIIDAEGIALVSIQALYEMSVEKDKKIEELQQRIEKLEQLVAKLTKK